ncbi:MAG: HDOD domain-containing protein [Desulfovibrionales bacterium]
MDDLKTEYKGRILEVKDLPTLPNVLDKVSELVKDQNSSTEQIAKVIAMDQVLSAKVLKMVNSPIYGFPRRIGTIQHALVLLGFGVIRGLIISTSVFDVMAKSMVGLWEHSVGCALACSSIAKAAGFDDPEEYAVAGLLHDLGKVVSLVQLPELKEEIDALVQTEDLSYFEAEKRVMGFGHDRINAWLSSHWNLPANIKEGLTYHHAPDRAQVYPDIARAVHVGDFLVKVLEVGSGGDDHVPYLQKSALKGLGLKTVHLEQILDNLSQELVDMESLYPSD